MRPALVETISVPSIEAINNAVVPDYTMPAQFWAVYEAGGMTPEKRLMLAVFEDALSCVRGYPILSRTNKGQEYEKAKAKFIRQAKAWFMSDDTSYLFAFESICDAMGWNADKVRKELGVG